MLLLKLTVLKTQSVTNAMADIDQFYESKNHNLKRLISEIKNYSTKNHNEWILQWDACEYL